MRGRSSKRLTVEASYVLNIREHLASIDSSMADSTASFTVIWDDGMRITANVRLVTTTPHFGGVRYWYECPRCKGRVAKLYVTGTQLDLACRRCCGLVYLLQYRKDGRTALLHAIATGRLTRKARGFVQQLQVGAGNGRARMGHATAVS